jgi:pimeloyl-ACP methyl ester carboxylesterase/uncharacterized protein YndB with AHSA1/START domain
MKKSSVKLRKDQVDLHYRYEGSGKITLLFIHGWNIDSSYWDEQIDYFSEAYTVYAIDLPGFGDSEAERSHWSMEEYALDVKDFIKTLDLKNIILIGHSMAGNIIVEVALKSSDEILGVIGIDNMKAIGKESLIEEKLQIDNFIGKLHTNFKDTVSTYVNERLLPPTSSDDVRKRVKKDFEDADADISVEVYRNLTAFSETLAEKLKMLPQKLYLINSDLKPTYEKGLAESCLNGYEVVIIRDTGHFPMIEKTTEFNELLNGVLNRIVTNFENDLMARASVRIEAPASKVWKALTDEGIISQYMQGITVESEWEAGKSITWNGIWNGHHYDEKGEIISIVPGMMLSFTNYSNDSDKPDEKEYYHTVAYQLAQQAGHTSVLIVQDNNQDTDERDKAAYKWDSMLNAMKDYLEEK